MQKISDGYYYEVYDLNNGRVFKKKKSFMKIAEAIKGKVGVFTPALIYKTFIHVHKCESVTKRIRDSILPKELLANPVFVSKTDYEQDSVTLLMDYFDSHSLGENKRVIDLYMNLIKEFLRYGLHDHVYKFKNSYGVNAQGGVVCIDFNEMTFSKDAVLTFVQTEEWRTQAQFTKFSEGELKDYLGQKFRETLTSSVVNQHWNSFP